MEELSSLEDVRPVARATGASVDGEEARTQADELTRARIYALLGRMLARPPGTALLRQVAALGGDTTTAMGRAFDELALQAAGVSAQAAQREYDALFIGLDRGELVPYASFYRTGFLLDRPLARLRRDMARLGIERAAGVTEPEDHVATLCEIMAGLLGQGLGTSSTAGGAIDLRAFFDRHLGPWVGRFFADLERAGAARLYRPVGTIGRLLTAAEAALAQQQQEQGQGR